MKKRGAVTAPGSPAGNGVQRAAGGSLRKRGEEVTIQKSKRTTHLFTPAQMGWQTLDQKLQFEVAKAMANPVRRWIYEELDSGPIRQSELAKRASTALGRKVPAILVSHHLKLLERAGLVGTRSERNRVKTVYLARDIRIQVKPRDDGTATVSTVARTPEKFVSDLKRVLRGSFSEREMSS